MKLNSYNTAEELVIKKEEYRALLSIKNRVEEYFNDKDRYKSSKVMKKIMKEMNMKLMKERLDEYIEKNESGEFLF